MKIKKILQEIKKNPFVLIQAPIALLLTGLLGEMAHISVKLGYRRAFRQIIVFWSRALCWLLGIKINCSNLPQLSADEAYIFVANHQTWLDVLIIAATLPVDTIWVAKKEIKKIPVIGRAIKAGGFLFTSRGEDKQEAISVIEQSINYLRQGMSIFIFPEGTRSFSNDLGCFKSGAFRTAKVAPAVIVPIYVRTHHILTKGSLAPKPLPATINYGEVIALADINKYSLCELKNLTKARITSLS